MNFLREIAKFLKRIFASYLQAFLSKVIQIFDFKIERLTRAWETSVQAREINVTQFAETMPRPFFVRLSEGGAKKVEDSFCYISRAPRIILDLISSRRKQDE